MKNTLIIASLCATSVLAKPVHDLHDRLHRKRWYNFVEDVTTVTATVTGGQDSGSGWSWGNWGGWQGAPDTAAASTAAPAPVPVVTEDVYTTITMGGPAPTPPPAAPSAPAAPPSPPAAASPAAASSAPASSASSPSQGTGPGGVDIAAILDQHNNHRANASVPALTWSTDMANIAAQIAASCVYAHNTAAGGGGYGQNIGAGAPPQDIPAMITNEMYDGEINSYPLPYGVEPDMTNFEQWGHYSQIVWKSTVSVGCAVQDCTSQGGLQGVGSDVSPYFAVCNYSPPGNFGGEYAANVLAPNGGLASVTV